jgi:hypothetical protein
MPSSKSLSVTFSSSSETALIWCNLNALGEPAVFLTSKGGEANDSRLEPKSYSWVYSEISLSGILERAF